MTQRLVVRSVDVRSVVRIAFAVSLSAWSIAFVGVVALYVLGLVSGGLGGIEGFIASLGFAGFRLSILPFIGVFIVAAALASAVTAVLAGLGAFLYNALFPLVGGVHVVVETRDRERPPAPAESVRPPAPPPPPPRPMQPPLPHPPPRPEPVAPPVLPPPPPAPEPEPLPPWPRGSDFSHEAPKPSE